MSDILRIIEKYNNLEGALLLHPDLAQDIQILGDHIKKHNDQDSQNAIQFLNELEDKITDQIEVLAHELKDKPNTLDRIRKNADACLAYTQHNKNRKES